MSATVRAASPPVAGSAVVLHNVSWEFYERFLVEMDEQHVRHTYDNGELELMSPYTMRHECPRNLLARLVETLTEELNIPILSVGSVTLRSRKRRKGIEPDEGFYIAHEAQMRMKDRYDEQRDPPPDLVIEIDYTSASLPRLPVYARLGVPEIWHYEDGEFTVLVLKNNGEYGKARKSLAFPVLPLTEFQRFVVRDPLVDETTWLRRFRAWVRERCLPKE
jgi:Uma2 family endonuclease